MIDDVYFFDSYAIIEFLLGNENYEKYKGSSIVTNKLNLFEVYYWFLRNYGKNKADDFLKDYYKFVVDFDEDIISNAAVLKYNLKKRSVSMTDCIGYCWAKSWGVKFLTGDKEFENIEGVEFVK